MCSGPTSWAHPTAPSLIHSYATAGHSSPLFTLMFETEKFEVHEHRAATSLFLAVQWLVQRRISNVGINLNGKV